MPVVNPLNKPSAVPLSDSLILWLMLAAMAGDFLLINGEPIGPSSRRTDLIISEVMYRPTRAVDGMPLEYIELYNTGLLAIALDGYRLSGEWDFTFPPNTQLEAGSFLVVASHPEGIEANYPIQGVLGGFSQRLSNGGGSIRLHHRSGALLLEIDYKDESPWPLKADEPGYALVLSHPSFGENDPRAWTASQELGGTPGRLETVHILNRPEVNLGAEFGDIIFSEIMFHPFSGESRDEYLELYNRSNKAIDLSDWSIAGGIRFTFPKSFNLKAKKFLVIAKDLQQFRDRYPHVPNTMVLGDYQGSLSNRGETLRLIRYIDVNGARVGLETGSLTYYDGGEWPTLSDGAGSSLELVDLRSDPRLGANWASSNESAKSLWTSFEATAITKEGIGSADELEILLMGSGECLLDNIRVQTDTGVNQLKDTTFKAIPPQWLGIGTHDQTTIQASAQSSARYLLHLKAVARGNTGPNKIAIPLTTSIEPGERITLAAEARWLSGHPDILFRLKGNALELPGTMLVPSVLGTPGVANSRGKTNLGPAITQVQHSPILPVGNETVSISARVHDPDRVQSVQLSYRIDPQQTTIKVPMNDAGTKGDQVANDGIYTAVIPVQQKGRLVAFRITAADQASPSMTTDYPAGGRGSESLIRFGEIQPPGEMPTYRLWMTASTLKEWTTREKLNNTPLPVTFVYNDQRAVYGAKALYAGSPHMSPLFDTPTGRPCGYNLEFPGDQRFLGVKELALDWPDRDPTAIQEPTAYWFAEQVGLPFSHRRFIHLHVNGVTSQSRGTPYEDAQQINSTYLSSWHPNDSDGDLFKAEQWFEFPPGQRVVVAEHPKLTEFRTPNGDRDLSRYRWIWLKRADKNNAHDYANLFNLVNTANLLDDRSFTQSMNRLIDIEEWMGVLALEQIVVNFDAYGYDIGKNMYAYKPKRGPWQLFMWDIDWVMLVSRHLGYTAQSPLMYREPTRFSERRRDPIARRMYNTPEFQRAYWRTIKSVVEGPMQPTRINPRLNALHQALVSNGISQSARSPLTPPDEVKQWIAARRAYLQEQLLPLRVPFQVQSTPESTESGSIRLIGSAPVEVQQIEINGSIYAPNWSTATEWNLELSLPMGEHLLSIRGVESNGAPLPTAQAQLEVTIHTGTEAAPRSVTINEWMAHNVSALLDPADGDSEDWFELYNSGDLPIDLSGYSLADTMENPEPFLIPAGTVINPKRFLLVWADNEVTQNGSNDDLHVDFRLNREGERIILRDPQGVLIDRVSFGPQTADRSEGRHPDGSVRVQAQWLSTPGTSNQSVTSTTFRNVQLGKDDTILLQWLSEIGSTYEIQTSDRLVDPRWTPIQQIVGTGSTEQVAVSTRTTKNRFFRLLQLTQDDESP